MGVSDMFDKAKDKLSGHESQVEGGIDKAADAVKAKTPDNVDGAVDKGADAAKGALGKEK